MFKISRLFVLCLYLGLCWAGTGCFRQGPAEESVIQQPSVYTLVLQGYETGTVRRDLQALLQQFMPGQYRFELQGERLLLIHL